MCGQITSFFGVSLPLKKTLGEPPNPQIRAPNFKVAGALGVMGELGAGKGMGQGGLGGWMVGRPPMVGGGVALPGTRGWGRVG